MKRKEGPAPDAPTFESMMERLEQLVGTLESGNLSLEESIHSFEEGMALVKRCTEVLDQAEQRIQKLTRDAQGAPRTEPVAEDDEADEGRSGELPF
ncbi:MAG TPA: exodeoxyribonuclease VII small subunit [Candidatus Eisenbacteria bacterium]|jgi:exodeoxyribonuclease VII small subunit|nr:exodeoxyribonuclease VII small subunit [Candidatus Eisenbacteria bacterium]